MTKEEFWNSKKNLLLTTDRAYRSYELGIRYATEEYIYNAKNIIDNLLYYLKSCNCERSNYAEIEEDIKQAEDFINNFNYDILNKHEY